MQYGGREGDIHIHADGYSSKNITETTNKQVTLDISNTKNSGNFKASIGFTPPSGGEAPLAGI